MFCLSCCPTQTIKVGLLNNLDNNLVPVDLNLNNIVFSTKCAGDIKLTRTTLLHDLALPCPRAHASGAKDPNKTGTCSPLIVKNHKR